jgi:hypothetical protein
MRIYVDYDRSIRCMLGRHDKGDAVHGRQGGFTPLGRGCARFCLCECHDAEPPSDGLGNYYYRITPIVKTPADDG